MAVGPFHPARPSDRWSRVANCRATSNGSLKVFEWFVEGGIDGAGEPDVIGDSGKRRKDGKRVRPAHHVQVMNAAEVLTQLHACGEEEEVEQAALGGAGQVHERLELHLTARLGI